MLKLDKFMVHIHEGGCFTETRVPLKKVTNDYFRLSYLRFCTELVLGGQHNCVPLSVHRQYILQLAHDVGSEIKKKIFVLDKKKGTGNISKTSTVYIKESKRRLGLGEK